MLKYLYKYTFNILVDEFERLSNLLIDEFEKLEDNKG